MPAAYTTRKDWPGPRANGDGVWVIYATHDEVSTRVSRRCVWTVREAAASWRRARAAIGQAGGARSASA